VVKVMHGVGGGVPGSGLFDVDHSAPKVER
jgi:hypothetical protein